MKVIRSNEGKVQQGTTFTNKTTLNRLMPAQGEGGIGLFVVVSGTAEAILKQPDGETSVVNTFGPTDFFGELALLDEGPRTASVVAKETTICVGILRWDFLAMLKSDADMAVSILLEVAHRFRILLGTM